MRFLGLLALLPSLAFGQFGSHLDPTFVAQRNAAPAGFVAVSGLVNDNTQRGAGLTGAADSKTGIVSFWYKASGNDENERTLFIGNYPAGGDGGIGIHIYRYIDQAIFIDLYNSAGTRIMGIQTPASWGGFFAGEWRHLVCSWNLATTTCDLYLDGVPGEAAFEMNDDTIDYTQTDWWFGAKGDATDATDACIGEFYVNFGEFLDLTDSANREKFYDSGEAIDLGADGSTPTGNSPEIYFRTWTPGNVGTGGAFVTVPYTACDTPTNTPISAGLVSYWKLDESSGNAADSVGPNTLVNNNSLTYVSGLLNNCAQCVFLTDKFLGVADNATLNFTTEFSLSIWVNRQIAAPAQALAAKWTYATQGGWVLQGGEVSGADLVVYIATSLTDPGTGCRMDFDDANNTDNTWYHLVLVYNGGLSGNANRLKLYQNGTPLTLTATSGAVPASLQSDTADFNLGHFGGALDRSLDGKIDETGLWNRALTALEVSTLYNSGTPLAYPFQ